MRVILGGTRPSADAILSEKAHTHIAIEVQELSLAIITSVFYFTNEELYPGCTMNSLPHAAYQNPLD